MKKKNILFPLILTILVLVIIIYLIVNLKQPYVECSKVNTDDFGITVKEDLVANLDSNKISKMVLTRTISFPDKYALESNLEAFKFALEKTYEYLDKDSVKITINDNSIVIKVEVDKNETLILNNIEFFENNGLQIKINPNIKSSEVVTLSVKDKYTEGELMTRLKNNGYVCK